MSIDSTGAAYRMTRRLQGFGGAVLVAGVAAVLVAAFAPVESEGGAEGMSAVARTIEPLDDSRPDIRSLLSKMAGTVLIRPAQVKAAVMDRGLARKLLARLKLQGVVQTGEGYTAYIKVEKQGVESVREGGQVLEMTVEKIEPGRVTFSLDGVVVELAQ